MMNLNLLVALALSVPLPDSLSMFLANRSTIANYDATVQWTTTTPAGEPSTCRTRFRATAAGKVAVNQLGYANGAVEIDWNGLTMEASPIGYFFDGSRSYTYADDDLLVEVRNGYGEHPPITAPISLVHPVFPG